MTHIDMNPRRAIVAVVGGMRAPESVLLAAEQIGCGIVEAGHRLVTGGLGGVMAAASRGARQSSAWRDGDIIGVLPDVDREKANEWVDIVIPTGMSYMRNALVVAMAHAVIAVGGGAGTLSEIALAWQYGRPVIALDLGEGWSSRLAGQALDDRRSLPVVRATSVAELLKELQAVLAVPGRTDHAR